MLIIVLSLNSFLIEVVGGIETVDNLMLILIVVNLKAQPIAFYIPDELTPNLITTERIPIPHNNQPILSPGQRHIDPSLINKKSYLFTII
jgi:hypothetical protein